MFSLFERWRIRASERGRQNREGHILTAGIHVQIALSIKQQVYDSGSATSLVWCEGVRQACLKYDASRTDTHI